MKILGFDVKLADVPKDRIYLIGSLSPDKFCKDVDELAHELAKRSAVIINVRTAPSTEGKDA